MASSSRPHKKSRSDRGKQPESVPQSRLDVWFSEEKHKKDYSSIFGNKEIIEPKFIKVQWFKDEGFQFPALLEYQGTVKLMELSGDYYPELVKAFYTTLRATLQGHLIAEVKGKKITVDNAVWDKVAGLNCDGLRGFEDNPEGYTRINTYRGMLLNPTAPIRNRLGVGGLTAEDRVILYLITYVLTPRARNHAQATDDDLQLVYGLKTCQRMNWPLVIAETMMKSKRLVEAELPYAVLISKILEHFEVPVKGEVTHRTSANRNSYITKKHLEKLGMKKVGDQWSMASEGPALDADEMEDAMAQAEQQEESRWSPFETLMIQKMDALLRLQQDHSAEVYNRLDSMESRLNNIETRLALSELDETHPNED